MTQQKTPGQMDQQQKSDKPADYDKAHKPAGEFGSKSDIETDETKESETGSEQA